MNWMRKAAWLKRGWVVASGTAGLILCEIGWAATHGQVGQAPARHVVEVGAHEVSFAFSEGPGRAIHLDAECVVPIQPAVAWGVLTDYDHLAEFVPFLTESRMVGVNQEGRLLRQNGRVGWLVFSQRFTVTFRVVEQPMQDIWFDAIEGDFRHFQGNWHLEAQGDRTLVRHTVELEPAFFVPRWMLRLLERHIMLESLEAIIQRCLDESRHSSVSTG